MNDSITNGAKAGLRKDGHFVSAAMVVAGTILFVAIAADVQFHGKLKQADAALAPLFYEHAQGWAILVCAGISGLGELFVIVPLVAFVGVMLILRRRWRKLLVWLLGMAGSGIINPALKAAFAIPRPSQYTYYHFPEHSGYSFPSGHTMAVTIAAGLIAMLYLHSPARPISAAKQRLVVAAAVAISLLEAFSLLYVGVHFLTDVLGGLAVSLAWLGVMRMFLPRGKETLGAAAD